MLCVRVIFICFVRYPFACGLVLSIIFVDCFLFFVFCYTFGCIYDGRVG